MKRVYQTRYGGPDADQDHRGNCAQACIASILELDLEQTLDISQFSDAEFYDQLTGWLNRRGYHMICFPFLDINGDPLCLPGYYIIGGDQVGSGIKHVQVAFNGKIIHDPISPDFICPIEPVEIWLIYPMNPVSLGVVS